MVHVQVISMGTVQPRNNVPRNWHNDRLRVRTHGERPWMEFESPESNLRLRKDIFGRKHTVNEG